MDTPPVLRLILKVDPLKTTSSPAVDNGQTTSSTSTANSSQVPDGTHRTPAGDNSFPMYFFIFLIIFIPAVLLPGLGVIIYWRCRGRRQRRTENQEQRGGKESEEITG
ncbi:hypothetical protein AOLI_G00039150 [Acnodon oligacanthus]